MPDRELSSKEAAELVARDAARVLLAEIGCVLITLLVARWSHGFAVVLFWLDAVGVGLLSIFALIAMLATGALLCMRIFGVRENRDLWLGAEAIRLVQLAALLYALYFMYIRLYPGARFLGYFA